MRPGALSLRPSVFVVLLLSTVSEAQVLSVGNGFDHAGGVAQVDITLETEAAVTGWTFGVCHDSGVTLSDDAVASGVGLDGISFATHALAIYPDEGWTAVAVLADGRELAAGSHELYVVDYQLSEVGSATLRVCDSLGSPAIAISLVIDGTEVVPDTIDGSAEARPEFLRGDINGDGVVNGSDWVFQYPCPFSFGCNDSPCAAAADVNGNGIPDELSDGLHLLRWLFAGGPPPPAPGPVVCGIDPRENSPGCERPPECRPPPKQEPDPDYRLVASGGTGVIGGSFTVNVTLVNDGDPVVGLQLGVCHGDLVSIDAGDIAQGADLAGLDVLSSTISVLDDQGGWSAAFVLDPTTDLLGTGEWDLYSAAYALDASGTTAVEICANGDPAVAPLVITRGAFVTPEVENAEITIIDVALFRRGDANGRNGVVPLTDAIYLFQWGFLEGPPPPCMIAADVDDSGEVRVLLDGIYLLRWGFLGGDVPPAPGPFDCGKDETPDELDCATLPADCR